MAWKSNTPPKSGQERRQRRRNVFEIGGGRLCKIINGGGGAVHFWHTENTLSLIIHGFANRYSITERA